MKLREIINPDVHTTTIENKCMLTPQRSREIIENMNKSVSEFIDEAKRQEREGGERKSTGYKKLFSASPVNWIGAIMQDVEVNDVHELAFVMYNAIQTYMEQYVLPLLAGDEIHPIKIVSLLEELERQGKSGHVATGVFGKGGDA